MVVSSVSFESLHVSWTEPTNCSPTDYIVTYELTFLDQCLEISDQLMNRTISNTTLTIDGLEAFSTYSINVFGRVNGVMGEPRTGDGTTGEEGN